jgi:hypothetical protein
MDKRLAKRHKRQVARAKEKAKVSEPDVRTSEEIAAAKAISRSDLRHDSNPWPTLPSDAEGAEKEPENAGEPAGPAESAAAAGSATAEPAGSIGSPAPPEP